MRALGLALTIACTVAATDASAMAETDAAAELDQLSEATSTAGSGVALARSLTEEGDLLGAVAALERVLIEEPEAQQALLLHAALLCRLDDPEGARLELAPLRQAGIEPAAWQEVVQSCGETLGSTAEEIGR